ncbi:MAG: GNAT family N-acetyltransferase [Candidatus Choladocola sp.]|nr:GNAT family N-acetyltransferase [Candidatus Choladocola sp.]
MDEKLYFMEADETDRKEIMKLYRAAIGSEGCTWSSEYPNEEISMDDLRRGDLFCLKRVNGEIVGALSIDDDEAVDALSCWSQQGQPSAELSRLVVKEMYQNMGIARLLLCNGMDTAQKRGYRSVHFLVSKTNEKALRSYARLSFEKKGESDLFGGDWWCYEKVFPEGEENGTV